MDIDLLSKMVKELILDNDRVVLPDLGSFVAEIVPSNFSDRGYTINPPYRRLYFRSRPDEGDGLVRFYAESNKVDLDVAERIIKDFISELKTLLHTRKTVVFPGLGRLRATKENNIFFVANEDLDIYPAGFGLEPISLKTHQETGEEVSAAVEGLKSLLNETETVPVPVQEPTTVPVHEQATEPVQEPVSEPELEPETEPVPEVVPVPEAVPDPVEVPQQSEETKTNVGKVLLIILCVIAAIAVLLLLALAIAGRVWPEWVDTFLYTPDELKILNHKL
jgi:nucleoid DNA-binding protein